MGNRRDEGRAASRWSRVAFAAAFVVLVVGTLGSFGGLSYAASSSSHALRTVANAATGHKVLVRSSASDQYPHQVLGVSKNNNKKPPAVAAAAPSGTLPFTGVSLGVTLLLSLALTAGGFFLRRAGRSQA